MEDNKFKLSIKLSNAEVVFPGQEIPKSHVFGISLSEKPKLAKANLSPPKGQEVIVSGLSYFFNRKEYHLFKNFGVKCIYNPENGWITPLLREAKDNEKETLKWTEKEPFHKPKKVGPTNLFWPIIVKI